MPTYYLLRLKFPKTASATPLDLRGCSSKKIDQIKGDWLIHLNMMANYELRNRSANSAIYIYNLSQKRNQQNLKNQSVISGRH